MSTHIEAAGQIRNLAKLYKHMSEAADLLEKIGSLEQATTEANQATEAARTRCSAVEADLANLRTEVQLAQGEAAIILAGAEEKAAEVVNAANVEATRIRDSAAQHAAGSRDAVRIAAEQVRAGLEREAATVRAAIAEGQAEIEVQQAAIAAARAEVGQLNAQAAEVRAKLQGLVANL